MCQRLLIFLSLSLLQGVAARLGVDWSVAKKWAPLAKDGTSLHAAFGMVFGITFLWVTGMVEEAFRPFSWYALICCSLGARESYAIWLRDFLKPLVLPVYFSIHSNVDLLRKIPFQSNMVLQMDLYILFSGLIWVLRLTNAGKKLLLEMHCQTYSCHRFVWLFQEALSPFVFPDAPLPDVSSFASAYIAGQFSPSLSSDCGSAGFSLHLSLSMSQDAITALCSEDATGNCTAEMYLYI